MRAAVDTNDDHSADHRALFVQCGDLVIPDRKVIACWNLKEIMVIEAVIADGSPWVSGAGTRVGGDAGMAASAIGSTASGILWSRSLSGPRRSACARRRPHH